MFSLFFLINKEDVLVLLPEVKTGPSYIVYHLKRGKVRVHSKLDPIKRNPTLI